MNEFKLSPLEKSQVLRDAKQLTSQSSSFIRYFTEGSFIPGMEETEETSWSDFSEYPSVIQEIDEFSSRRYDYGDMIEGDVIILLPYDTDLPKDANKYEFKYNDDNYISKKLQQEQLLDGTVTHYYLVGKLL